MVVGSWGLVSHEVRDESGAVVGLPMGERPSGLLVYTPDGRVSVHLMAADRPPFGAGSQRQGTACEKGRAMDTHFGYAGGYTVGDGEIVHHIEVSSFPNWTGAEQRRTVELDGDLLTLSTQPQGGRRSVLVWRRLARWDAR